MITLRNYYLKLVSIFIISFVSISLFFTSCDTSNTKKIIEHSAAITMIDANSKNKEIIQELSIEIIDPKQQLLFPTGERVNRTFNISDGVLILGLPNDIDSLDFPYTFKIKVSNSNYLTKTETIVFKKKEDIIKRIFMINLRNPPLGVSYDNSKLDIKNGAIDSEVDQTIILDSTSYGEKISLKFPKGIELYGENGETISSREADVKATFFGAKSYISSNYLPKSKRLVDKNNKLRNRHLQVISWLYLNIIAGSQKVDSFSTPISAKFYIKPNGLNPQTNKPYQSGDEVNLWSLSDTEENGEQIWRYEDTIILEEEGDNIVANAPISHLSIWSIATDEAICNTPPTIEVKVKNPFAAPKTYYCQFVNAQNCDPNNPGNCFYTFTDQDILLPSGEDTLTFDSLPVNRNLFFGIFSSIALPDADRKLEIRNPEVFRTCTGPENVVLIELDDLPCLELDAIIQFNPETNPQPGNPRLGICNNAIWFRGSSSRPWRFAGFMDNNILRTYEMPVAGLYTVGLWYDTDATKKLHFNLTSEIFALSINQSKNNVVVENELGTVVGEVNVTKLAPGPDSCTKLQLEITISDNSISVGDIITCSNDLGYLSTQ